MMRFSVVTSVYRNDKPEYVARALDSITIFQTRKPDEVVLVVDGPVSDELASLLKEKQSELGGLYNIIWLSENRGLGNALQVGVKAAKYDIIARMDSDDVATPNRFSKQVAYLESHSDCDIVGGQISEFVGDEINIVGSRIVPNTNDDIYKWMKGRCPFNHMSIMARKASIISAGNYADWHFNEDYYLWIRMALKGCKFANLSDTLVNVRVGKEMYQRRGGWKYFKSEKGLQDFMLKNKMISHPKYCYNVLGRFVIQVVMPNKLRGLIFQKLFRKQGN